ncbi:hypothetical protein ACTI_10490 [Actinoplanes sp. OR16]|nr:hypothetical protein ACTI_10490 [Actinoplanes sp. OR16]
MFEAAGRHADTYPLAELTEVRRRGARRKRIRAAVASGAAVLVILAGAGVVWQRRHAEPILPATTPARVRGMEPVGEPLRAPAGSTWDTARVAGDRGYGLTTSPDSRVYATGAASWVSESFGELGYDEGPIAAPETLIVRTGTALLFHDPGTGTRRWELPTGGDDRFELYTGLIVRIDGGSHAVEAFDVVTGARLWSVPPGDDRPAELAGMRTAADPGEIDPAGGGPFGQTKFAKAFPLTGDRLAVVTTGGVVAIRDVRTGELVSSVPAAPAMPGTAVAYDGVVYTVSRAGDGTREVHATGATSSRVVFGDRRAFTGSFPCGTARLCVYEQRDSGTYLLVVDAADGRVVRETPFPYDPGVSSARLGRIVVSTTSGTGQRTVILGADGRVLADVPGVGGFIDDGNVLALVRDDATGRFTAVGISAVDGRQIPLGTMPEISGRCDWSADRLACPAGSELWTWRFVR